MRTNDERRTSITGTGAGDSTTPPELHLHHLHHTARASPPPPPPSPPPQPPPMCSKKAPTKCSPRPPRATPSVDRGFPCLPQLSTTHPRWQIGKKMAQCGVQMGVFSSGEEKNEEQKKEQRKRKRRKEEEERRARLAGLAPCRPAAGRSACRWPTGLVGWAPATDSRSRADWEGHDVAWPLIGVHVAERPLVGHRYADWTLSASGRTIGSCRPAVSRRCIIFKKN